MVQAMDEMEHPDLLSAINLMREMNANVQQVTQLVDNMLVRVRNGELTTDKGLSFLEMKYQMLLSYLINLTYIVLRKCSGEKIESDPTIDRLVEIRTVLEKVRPIDSKLKYQIDKLVRTAATGTETDSPQTYKANPDNLSHNVGNSDDSSDDGSDNEDGTKKESKEKTNVYVPPKLAAVHYDDNDNKKNRKEHAKKQYLNSNVMRELREEYSEAPSEVTTGNYVKHSISKIEQERTEYEENYLTRLPITKADKNRRRKLTTIGLLADEITGSGSKVSKGKRKASQKKSKGFKRKRIH